MTEKPIPPTQWRDSLHVLNNAAVASALSALGDDVPAAWPKAYETFRAGEWPLTCRTGLHCLQQNRDLAHAGLEDARQRLAAKPGSLSLQEFLGNCERIFDVAGEIHAAALATANGHNPTQVIAERKQRAALLQQAREAHNLRQIRNLPTSQEDVDRLADLLDAVAADEQAAEKAATEISALQAAVDAARVKAIEVLTDALDKQINAAAREIASRLNARQVAIGRAYPSLVDEKVLHVWQRAQHLAGVSAALDGEGVDLDETIGRALTPEQHQVLGSCVYRLQGRFLADVRGRQRSRERT